MIFKLDNVCCGYKDKNIFSGFSAEIASGKVFCLLGPNGIGKTTLFKTILGLIPLISGTITCDGTCISKISHKEYAKLIGYVPQSHSPPFSFDVVDVIVMGRTIHHSAFGGPNKKDYSKALDVMEKLEITHLYKKKYTEISGGERQMVLIARALVQEPKFLMMDEPTANLDFGNQARALNCVKKLADDGLGVIMTTHSPDQVFQCNADVALLQPNNKYICGNAQDVLIEENLMLAYGIRVAVAKINYDNNYLHICQPILK